jgi:hypothetical protein
MAIDKTTGKRKRVVIKEPKKKVPKYETDYEDALKRQLFEDEKKKESSKESDELDFYEDTREFHHHKREGE